MEDLIKKHEGLIHSLVNKAVNTFGMDEDDALSEAYFTCFKAVESYNPQLSKLSTWLYKKIQGRLIDLRSRKYYKNKNLGDDIPQDSYINRSMNDLIDSVDSSSAYVMRLVLDGKYDRVTHIKEHLNNIGWKQTVIRKTMKNVTMLVGEF